LGDFKIERLASRVSENRRAKVVTNYTILIFFHIISIILVLLLKKTNFIINLKRFFLSYKILHIFRSLK